MLVFVYGTLKRGYHNNRLLNDAKFIGTGKTVEGFSMTCVGFPFAHADGDNPIRGEVFEVDQLTLARLDRLESEGQLYDRRTQLIELDDGGTQLCMMYVACYGRPAGRIVMPSQDGTLIWPGQ